MKYISKKNKIKSKISKNNKKGGSNPAEQDIPFQKL